MSARGDARAFLDSLLGAADAADMDDEVLRSLVSEFLGFCDEWAMVELWSEYQADLL